MANTPRQKSLKLILPRSLGSKHFTSFSTWKEKEDLCEAPWTPQGPRWNGGGVTLTN